VHKPITLRVKTPQFRGAVLKACVEKSWLHSLHYNFARPQARFIYGQSRSAIVPGPSLRQSCRLSAVAFPLFDELDCRIRHYFSTLLNAGLAAVCGLWDRARLVNNVNAICCALCTYAFSVRAPIRLRYAGLCLGLDRSPFTVVLGP
jgi:hypothetical protein